MSYYTPKVRSQPQIDCSIEEFEEETNLLESFFRVTTPINAKTPVLQKSLCHKCYKIVLKDSTNNSIQHFPNEKVCKCQRINNRIVRN